MQYNPFRYRGYYYDTELGLYYLNSRYYDANTGRFISPDRLDVLNATPDQLTDKNLFAYCDNNPILRTDGDGDFWNVLIGAVVGVASQFVSDCISSAMNGTFETSSWSTYIGAAVGGAITGAIGNPIVGNMAGAAVSTMITMVGDNIQNSITGEGEIASAEEIIYTTTNNAMIGALFGALPILKGSDEPIEKVFTRSTALAATKNAGVEFVNSLLNTTFSSISGVILEDLPNTHVWD